MSAAGSNPADVKMLPGTVPTSPVSSTNQPSRQLAELPRDELETLAEEFGIDLGRHDEQPIDSPAHGAHRTLDLAFVVM